MRSTKASKEEQRQFGDNIFTTIMNYVYWFLAGSVMFIISNILFIACMFFVLQRVSIREYICFRQTYPSSWYSISYHLTPPVR